MTRRIHVAPEAEAEIAAAALWYESKRGGLGAEFVAAIDEAMDLIRERPAAYAIWRPPLPQPSPRPSPSARHHPAR